ncbi:hypothetical protein F8154_12155 [Alkaliphilus pronyensis]|uniref:Copper amine oxidase-like N-terminal domain-containing protein n=1 Tax=Alkaliphilus pronyensis TaxID=1482732 RepID=A0A6I0FDB4_9FIRM|nr:stalk domain-containing protein [Alkaliphilus pronyensis]KAB3532157.1 hypothetical protein F8154_12155 [Alkaliphilus pronyensis]
MFKRPLLVGLIIIFVLSLSVCWGAIEYYEIKAYINNYKIFYEGKEILTNNESYIYNSKIHVPLRDFAEALSLEVEWNGVEGEVRLSKGTVIEACNPFIKEAFIYGIVTKIDWDNRLIDIEQHLDHNSREIYEELPILEDVEIVIQRNHREMKIDFKDLRVGDVVGIIVNEGNEVRAIIVDA